MEGEVAGAWRGLATRSGVHSVVVQCRITVQYSIMRYAAVHASPVQVPFQRFGEQQVAAQPRNWHAQRQHALQHSTA